jgi:hypothetical protein
LERAKRLIDGYGDNASFNSHTFFDICFNESLSIDIDLENVLEKYYPKLFSASAYSAFRFLKADQLEVAMIAGFLSGHEDLQDDVAGLERKLSHLVKTAKHGNIKKGRIVKPTSSILLKTTTDHILAKQEMNLHPLSSLLILNYYEEELINNCGYERIEREKEILTDKLNSI